jgi:hypothetical protein|uniref:Poly(A) polymerase catalytic subunit domain-containing protein n=1 Tax=viral metagenome TaxID=1070528 RepID=A0A6C0DYQ6_9ZZZZ
MKYNTKVCKDDMSFEECELAILREAVDETDILQKQKIANSVDVKRMIEILENFLIRKKLVCYGGTAINNILPKYAQFYNRDVEVPDYDFFSMNALDDAKELTDIFYKEGYLETEAKSGIHKGTYKVFVNYIPMADITQLNRQIYTSLQKHAISVAGIKYAPPNYLRMSMFLELSRPAGDVTRWEKVLKRLTLLNKYHPLKSPYNCKPFQRQPESLSADASRSLYHVIRDSFIEQGLVFFGGYAASLYSKYMNKSRRGFIQNIPDFDVLAEDPERSVLIVRERLEEFGFKNVKTVRHDPIDDVIPYHIQLTVDNETLAFIFKPIACYSYNTIELGNKQVNVATVNTMLSFYLAFIYTDRPYFDSDRILCMAQMLFDVEQNNRLNQTGLLKRFSIQCYGKQPTLESIRAEKAEKFKELVHKKDSREWNEWFFKYSPNANGVIPPVKPSPVRRESVSKKSSSSSSPYMKSFIDPRSYEKKGPAIASPEKQGQKRNRTAKPRRRGSRRRKNLTRILYGV